MWEKVRLPGKSWKYVSAQQSPDHGNVMLLFQRLLIHLLLQITEKSLCFGFILMRSDRFLQSTCCSQLIYIYIFILTHLLRNFHSVETDGRPQVELEAAVIQTQKSSDANDN